MANGDASIKDRLALEGMGDLDQATAVFKLERHNAKTAEVGLPNFALVLDAGGAEPKKALNMTPVFAQEEKATSKKSFSIAESTESMLAYANERAEQAPRKQPAFDLIS